MPSTRTIVVPSPDALGRAVRSHLAEGFVVQASNRDEVYLFKAKRFQTVWAVVSTMLCGLPLLVYLVVYLLQKDQAVRIVVQRQPRPVRRLPPPRHRAAQMAEPHWDGSRWVEPGES